MENTREIISVAQAGTLYGLLRERARRAPDALAYRQYDRRTESWQNFTWSEVIALTARWQEAFRREGLVLGDRVAISIRNSVEWVAFDQAALGLGLVVVPLYTDDRPENVAFILDESGAALLLVQDSLRWRRLAAVRVPGSLRRVTVLDADANERFEHSQVVAAAGWVPQGRFDLEEGPSDPHALASIVYTSGTTGRPKGVMLSHHNILSVVEAALQVVEVYREDHFLSLLPLSHMYERAVGYYLPMCVGSTVTYARSVATLADDINRQRPTVMLAVPRVFERIYGRLMDQLRKSSVLRRVIFHSAVRIGWKRFEWQQKRAFWSPLLLLWPLFDALVGRKIRARLGGRLRLAVSGGAALPPPVARVFLGLGLPVLQGYGLSEASPQVCVNRLDDNDPASVGLALPGIQVAIGENDELLVRSPGVMLGYWKNKEATAAMIHDGWLHTGDQARVRNGHIYITGRIKDILVLSNGEKVPPGEMEEAIGLDPLFDQVLVAGEGRSFLIALAVLNQERWAVIAREFQLDPATPASLEDRRVHHDIVTRIGRHLHGFPTWAKVRRVHLSLDPWTVENGLLTPTLKIRRRAVLAQYEKEIEHIYQNAYEN